MISGSPRVIAVRSGRIQPSGSWLYVWIDIDDGEIVYVGATGIDPELRAHLHLVSEDPAHGRVRATVPNHTDRDFDVLAFEVPDGVDRSAVKRALMAHLAGDDPGSLRGITEPIVRAVSLHGSK